MIIAVQRLNVVCPAVEAQGRQIRKLEDWRNIIVGGLTLLTFMVLLVGGWLLSKV